MADELDAVIRNLRKYSAFLNGPIRQADNQENDDCEANR